jgi:hypothetical protein
VDQVVAVVEVVTTVQVLLEPHIPVAEEVVVDITTVLAPLVVLVL